MFMSSRLRPPAGSKLVRPVPVGSGLRAPGSGLVKPGSGRPSPQPQSAASGMSYEREGPPMTRTTPVGAARRPPVNRQVTPSRTVQQQQQPQQQPPVSSQALAAPPPPTSNGTTAPSLEVGDNVLVNGIKPGVVAFLGPTQFARGTWAGVVLDSPEGKNNGSVNGVQYFVCEANRGLFSKPEKLTFVSKIQSKPPLPPSSAQASNASEAAFEVGDRVLTDSGKSGVVGFVGTTQFAKGVWAGVILDTTEGKNSGSVNGVQYFECEANHGIFTRLQKLKLVPKAGPPDEQWHPPPTGKLPPSSRGSSQATSSRGASQERGGPPLASIDLKALKEKLKLGDRVLVGGAKEGFLRYLGPTEFAKGVWAGVELEDAQGKNDGAVSGKRYVYMYMCMCVCL